MMLALMTFCLCLSAEPKPGATPYWQQAAGVHVRESEHLRFYYTADFRPLIPELEEKSESFLREFEKKWSIKLPDRKYRISLLSRAPSRELMRHTMEPKWLHATCEKGAANLLLYVSDMDEFAAEPVAMAIRHHLLHMLLKEQRKEPLPPWFEEGIVRHYTGFGSSTNRYLVTLAFRKTTQPKALLERAVAGNNFDEFHYGAALASRFVAWLWARQPGLEVNLSQALLRGDSVDMALIHLGLSNLDSLFLQFEKELRPNYGLMGLLKTLDFWLLLFGSLTFLLLIWNLWLAWRFSGLEVQEYEGRPIASVGEEHFQGPAFGGGGKPHPRRSILPPPRVPSSRSGSGEAAVGRKPMLPPPAMGRELPPTRKESPRVPPSLPPKVAVSPVVERPSLPELPSPPARQERVGQSASASPQKTPPAEDPFDDVVIDPD